MREVEDEFKPQIWDDLKDVIIVGLSIKAKLETVQAKNECNMI